MPSRPAVHMGAEIRRGEDSGGGALTDSSIQHPLHREIYITVAFLGLLATDEEVLETHANRHLLQMQKLTTQLLKPKEIAADYVQKVVKKVGLHPEETKRFRPS